MNSMLRKGCSSYVADLVEGDDVGMLQLGGGGGFLLEALQFVGVGEAAAADHLQGDDAIEADMREP